MVYGGSQRVLATPPRAPPDMPSATPTWSRATADLQQVEQQALDRTEPVWP